MSAIAQHTDCRQALDALKQRIQTSLTRAALTVNAEWLGLCWDIGRALDIWQHELAWGSAVVEQMRKTCRPAILACRASRAPACLPCGRCRLVQPPV